MLRSTAFALLLVSCSSPFTEARTSFDEGRYPDAAAAYRSLEPQARSLPRPELFDYALHRGLAHLALGDAVAAQRWLTVAKRLSDESPELPTSDQQGRLLSAWRAMGHMPGE